MRNGKSEWQTYKSDDVGEPEPLEYYNPMWGKCCQHVIYTVRINLNAHEEEGIQQIEVLTNHESSLEMA